MEQGLLHLLTKFQPRRARWRSMSQRTRQRYARSLLSARRCGYMMHGQGASSLSIEACGTLAARPAPHSAQVSAKESTMEEHTQRMRRRGARAPFFMRRHDCMMDGSWQGHELFEVWHPWSKACFTTSPTRGQGEHHGRAQAQGEVVMSLEAGCSFGM